jgi:hypothetical protein
VNTREKILSLDQARAAAVGIPVTAFVTHLEVLQADHIRALEAVAAESVPGKLFLVLTDPPSPLVALEDRAEVAAGLRMVDYVVPTAAGREPALDAIHPRRIIEDEEEDRGRTRRLIEHVRSRCAQ